MRTTVLMLMICGLAACAAPGEAARERATKEDAIRDLVSVRGLPEADFIRTRDSDSWQELEPHFLLYRARRAVYLVEFARPCFELNEFEVTPDVRTDASRLQARFDTIRGCRIHRIYALTEAEAVELEAIGEPPGSRN